MWKGSKPVYLNGSERTTLRDVIRLHREGQQLALDATIEDPTIEDIDTLTEVSGGISEELSLLRQIEERLSS